MATSTSCTSIPTENGVPIPQEHVPETVAMEMSPPPEIVTQVK